MIVKTPIRCNLGISPNRIANEGIIADGPMKTISIGPGGIALPKECWRLMGMSDEDYFKAAEVCSESQLYKQAGNSIVVDVLEAIFDTMLTETKTTQQMKLGDW